MLKSLRNGVVFVITVAGGIAAGAVISGLQAIERALGRVVDER